ncbi:histidine phosphatase family protein [Candidatus Nomurabacteria bacterium]|nr:histidine phosphatase family protein [Candidatus Nomurabacteria bacterium]
MLKKITQKTAYARSRPKSQGPYTQIYLIRHCKPDYTQQKELGDAHMPLDQTGLKQRKLLNKKLFSIHIDKVYTSEFLRAQQTAEIYLKKTKKNPIVDKRFNEVDWSEWYKMKYFNMSEKTRVKRVKAYKEMDKNLSKLQTRFRRILADIYHHNKGKDVAIFCHGNVIRSILTSILNTDVVGFLSIEVYQSSISKIVIDKHGYVKINYMNNIGHLPHKPHEDLFKFALEQ